MKKIFMLFFAGLFFLSNNAFADDDVWSRTVNPDAILNVLKTTDVIQYMDAEKFIDYIETHWVPTFRDVLDACLVSVSQDAEKNCETFFYEVVDEYNRLNNAKFAEEIGNPDNWQEVKVHPAELPNDESFVQIWRDLDGGTPVSGDCADVIVVKSGISVKLNCEAIKNGKRLSGYIDNLGLKKNKNWQFGFDGFLSEDERHSLPLSLKAVYGDENNSGNRVFDVRGDYEKSHYGKQNSSGSDDEMYDIAKEIALGRAIRYYAKYNETATMISHDCDNNIKKCAFVFAGEQTGERALVCCSSDISRSNNQVQVSCEIPYNWHNGDNGYTSVSDCM